jgi:hypothetical protein
MNKLMNNKPISQQLAEKTFMELGIDPTTGLPVNSLKPPVNSRSQPTPPFRIPALEKTKRQASSTQGYKASATWQTASLLRDMLTLWFQSQLSVDSLNLPLYSRLKGQILDAARSVVANLEEGWARPSSKELLDYLGFSQASLAEVRGDIERMYTDSILPSLTSPVGSRKFPSPPVSSRNSPVGSRKYSHSSPLQEIGIPTPSRDFPYPPSGFRANPGKYGNLRAKLREFAGKEIDPRYFSYEVFIELVNKTDWLMKRTVDGIDKKIITDETEKLRSKLNNHWQKNW